MINSKIFKVLLAAMTLSLVTGCSGGYTDFEDNLTMVVAKKKTQFDYLDSLVYAIAEENIVDCKNLSCAYFEYEPESFRFAGYDDESVQNKYEPLTIYIETTLNFSMKTIPFRNWQENHYSFDLYVDIYNCNTIDCRDADKIVVHSRYYEYSRLITPDEFSISSLKNSDIVGAKGDVSVFHLFNLKIDAEGLSLDWNVQIGKCNYTEWVDYHVDPLWG